MDIFAWTRNYKDLEGRGNLRQVWTEDTTGFKWPLLQTTPSALARAPSERTGGNLRLAQNYGHVGVVEAMAAM